jgi:hypothetical protein
MYNSIHTVVQFERPEDDGMSVDTSNLMWTKQQLNNQSLVDGITKITINYRQTVVHRTEPTKFFTEGYQYSS